MLMVLVSAAAYLGEPLFVMTDDAGNFFNQFGLATEELWKLATSTWNLLAASTSWQQQPSKIRRERGHRLLKTMLRGNKVKWDLVGLSK